MPESKLALLICDTAQRRFALQNSVFIFRIFYLRGRFGDTDFHRLLGG